MHVFPVYTDSTRSISIVRIGSVLNIRMIGARIDDVTLPEGLKLSESPVYPSPWRIPNSQPIIKMPKFIAIIAGAGPGTGSAVARRFAQAYPVVVLSRSQSSLDPLVRDITQSGGHALAVPTDVTDPLNMSSTMDKVKAEFGSDISIAAAIYNVASKFSRKPFLEQSQDEFLGSLEPTVKGAYNFAQATLPCMLNQDKAQYPPTLIFTGMNTQFALITSL